MAIPVYSTAFLAATGANHYYTETPEVGYVQLITNLDWYVPGLVLGGEMQLIGPAGNVVYTSSYAPGAQYGFWRGKIVVLPGQITEVLSSESDDFDVNLVGYLLTQPT